MKDEPLSQAMTAAPPPVPNCIVIYTGSSWQTQLGVGGYAAILCRYRDGKLETRQPLAGGAMQTSNIRMEMSAVIDALKQIRRDETVPIFVFTCNDLIMKDMTEWLSGWVRRGWRNGKGKRVENVDLWQEIVRLSEGLNVTFRWARNQPGNPMNDEVARLATEERDNWVRQHCRELFGDAA